MHVWKGGEWDYLNTLTGSINGNQCNRPWQEATVCTTPPKTTSMTSAVQQLVSIHNKHSLRHQARVISPRFVRLFICLGLGLGLFVRSFVALCFRGAVPSFF